MSNMGDPKKQRKKYDTPEFPWSKDTLDSELKLLGQYGLRNKREFWRHRSVVTKYRHNAISLLRMPIEKRKIFQDTLINKLYLLGLVDQNATIDDVFGLSVEDILERRLQTIVFRMGLVKSLQQSRQFITHGHISVNNACLKVPSYLVPRDKESTVSYSYSSPLSDENHPFRKVVAEVPSEQKDASRRE